MGINLKKLALMCILAAPSLPANNVDIKDLASTVKKIEEALAKNSITQEDKAALLKELDVLESKAISVLNAKWYLQVGAGVISAAATAWSLNKLYNIHYKNPQKIHNIFFSNGDNPIHENYSNYGGTFIYYYGKRNDQTVNNALLKSKVQTILDSLKEMGVSAKKESDLYDPEKYSYYHKLSYRNISIKALTIPIALIAAGLKYKSQISSAVKNIFGGGYKKDLEKIKQIRELLKALKTV